MRQKCGMNEGMNKRTEKGIMKEGGREERKWGTKGVGKEGIAGGRDEGIGKNIKALPVI